MSHFTTTLDNSRGSVFSSSTSDKRDVRQIHGAMVEVVDTFPASSPLNEAKQHDVQSDLESGMFTAVIVGFPPGYESPMHRTEAVNVGVVLEGTVELYLDSGEVRTLQKGDSYTQRATMHRWKNVSEGWARLATVTIAWSVENE